MSWEIVVKNIKKLHQSGWDIFRLSQRAIAWEKAVQGLGTSWNRDSAAGLCSHISDLEESHGNRINVRVVMLKELAVTIDYDMALLRLECSGVIADAVVGEVVEYFEC